MVLQKRDMKCETGPVDGLNAPISVLNIGLEGFADDFRRQQTPVVQVEWRPPAGGQKRLIDALSRMQRPEIDKANERTIAIMMESRPYWIDVQPALEAIPGMQPNHILHSGPPIEFERMCDPQQRAIEGACVFEGWISDGQELRNKIRTGEIALSPNYALGAVGAMCGVISPSMNVIVTENRTFGNRSWSTFNEGKGNVIWMGTYDAGTIERLKWFREVMGPGLSAALKADGEGIDIFNIIAEGVQMGDEVHARSGACTSVLMRRLAPLLLETDLPRKHILDIVRFIYSNPHFFLSLTLTACKVAADAAHGIPHATVVTAMSRNGVEFALRVGGGGDRWFIADTAPMNEAIYYPGYTADDAAGDIGDSAIVETLGLGGMVISAAPTVSSFVGGGMAASVGMMKKMQSICVGANPRFAPASADFLPGPLGIDIRKVVRTGTVPIIDTGVIHKSSGVGQIGAGIARTPIAVFNQALLHMDEENESK